MIEQLDIISRAAEHALESKLLSHGRVLNIPQQEGLLSYRTFLTEPADHARIDKRRAYVDMATGTGKTGLFSVLVRHAHGIAREMGHGGDFKTIIVEPTTILLRQTFDELISAAPELRNAVGLYGDGTKDIHYPITIMTYHAWSTLMEQGHLKGAIDFQIDDESHYSLSDRRQKIGRNILGNTVRLGLTASSQYDNQKTMEITHQNLLYRLPLRNAIERGFLADYAHVQFALARILPSTESGRRLIRGEAPELKQREWSKLIVEAYANGLDEISGRPLHEKIGAVFAANTSHADLTAEMLNSHPLLRTQAKERGFKNVAVSLHSKGVTPREQDDRLGAFKSGEYMIITGDKKIGPGFDHPPIKFSASYPGNSLVDTIQEVGRSTRYYVDPKTGESQGTVVFEAIPYIGHPDPVEDKKSETLALANTRTVYEILKSPFVYAPTRVTYRNDPKPKKKSGVTLSHEVSAEIFATLEDTLLVSKMIDKAQEELRMEISEVMRTDLSAKIAARGGFGGLRLVKAIEKYEEENNLRTTGIFYYEPGYILDGSVKSMQIKKWQRLCEVVDNLPLVEPEERIAISKRMLGNVRDKVKDKGGYGYVLLTREVEKYERENNLPSAGLNPPTVSRILQGHVSTLTSAQWQRFNDTLDSMPSVVLAERIEVTAAMLTNFKQKLEAVGDYGAIQLMQYVEEYEKAKDLESVDLRVDVISRLRLGSAKTIESRQWQRLNDVVADLPVVNFGERIEVTADMIADMQAKLELVDGFSTSGLVKLYETEKGLPSVGFNVSQLGNVLGERIKTIHLNRWRRMEDAIEYFQSMPKEKFSELIRQSRVEKSLSTLEGERIPFNRDDLRILEAKILERGDFGVRRLQMQVESYEEEHGLPESGISAANISTILEGGLQTVDKLFWERLNAAVDSMPVKAVVEKIELTEEMAKKIQVSLANKGVFAIAQLCNEINRLEKEQKLLDVEVNAYTITRIAKGSVNTISKNLLARIMTGLDAMPDVGERIKVTGEMVDSLTAAVKKKGGLTPGLLIKAVQVYEEKNFPENLSGITLGVFAPILDKKVKSILKIQWDRITETVDSLPVKAPTEYVTLTTRLCNSLSDDIAQRGNIGTKRLFKALGKYEKKQGLEPSGLTESILHHLMGNRAKKIEKGQWERLNAFLATLPVTGPRPRIDLTADMVKQLKADLKQKGNPGPKELQDAIDAYEKKHDLTDTDLNKSNINGFLRQKFTTVDSAQWKRLADVIATLPDKEVQQRIDLTKEAMAVFGQRYTSKGKPEPQVLFRHVQAYEQAHSLPQLDITRDKILRLLDGTLKSFAARDWERLNLVLDSLPDKEAPKMIPLTPEMLTDLRRKRAEHGNLGAIRIFNASEQTHSDVKLSVSYINQFLLEGCQIKTVDERKWTRLNEVLDGLPKNDVAPSYDAK